MVLLQVCLSWEGHAESHPAYYLLITQYVQVGQGLASQRHPALQVPVVPMLGVLVFLGCWETLHGRGGYHQPHNDIACLSPPVSLLTSEHPVEREALS